MANIELKNVYKVYEGGVKAVADFNLEIKDKEFIVFVGPSGCGKSTTLRMIAGLEEITSGDLLMDGERVNDVEPMDRNIAMVFQNYALYPHMTVFQNMAFGLKLRKTSKAEIERRVKNAAKILGIEDLLNRKPKALSGGQRQRVALGRAIVREPNVFLLDEPLSNLDAKLRVQMRVEITKLQKRLSTTFIYVTHDQTEAMTMGDRIVVMKDGIVQQVDSPATLYEQPRNIFVATFLGSPQMNILKVRLIKEEDKLAVILPNSQTVYFDDIKSKQLISNDYLDKDILFGIRPENISIGKKGVDVHIDAIEHLGSETIVYCKMKGLEESIIAKIPTNYDLKVDSDIKLNFDMSKSHGFDVDLQTTILGVPSVNYIKAKVKGDKLVIGGKEFVVPSFTQKILHSKIKDVTNLSIDVSKVSLTELKESICLKAKVSFKIQGNDNVTCYTKIEGLDDYFIFRNPTDTFANNDEVECYLALQDLKALDRNNLRVSSTEIISDNMTTCSVKSTETDTIIKLPKTTLKFKKMDVKDGDYTFRLHEFNIKNSYSKAYAKEKKIANNSTPNTIEVKAYDEDRVNEHNNICYLSNPNFNNYINVVIDDLFSVYKMPQFGLNITENDFDLLPLGKTK